MATITPKKRNPDLSEETQKLIYRAMGEAKEGRLDMCVYYKYRFMQALLSEQDLLKTLHYEEGEKSALEDGIISGDLYKDTAIFDYMKLPNLKDEVKNYICFEIEDSGYEGLYDRKLHIRCVSHEQDIKTDWAISRHDLLALIIRNKFNWSNIFGITLELSSDNEAVTSDGYVYRTLSYKMANPHDKYSYINNMKPMRG